MGVNFILQSNFQIKIAVFFISLTALIDFPVWAQGSKNSVLKQNSRLESFFVQRPSFGGKVIYKERLPSRKTPEGKKYSSTLKSQILINNLSMEELSPFLNEIWVPSYGMSSGVLNFNDSSFSLKILNFWGQLDFNDLVFKRFGGTLPLLKQGRVVLNPAKQGFSKGELKGLNLSFNEIRFPHLQGAFHISKDQLVMEDLFVYPGHGDILIRGNYWLKEKHVASDFLAKGLRLEDFIPDLATGNLAVEGKLETDLNDKKPVRTIKGNAKILANDGTLKKLGPTLEYLLGIFYPDKFGKGRKKGIEFTSLMGDVEILNGVAFTDNIHLLSPLSDLRLIAKSDLSTKKILGELRFQPLQLWNDLTKKIPLLGSFFKKGVKSKPPKSYFRIKGRQSKPKVELLRGKTYFGKSREELRRIIILKE